MSVTVLEHWVQPLVDGRQLHVSHSTKGAFDLGQRGVQIGLNSEVMPCHAARRHGHVYTRGQGI